jgi:probable F420-dependent oxidoreductase
MKLGVLYQADLDMQPHELARLLEERGVESLWFPEHTHIPASRETEYPGPGGVLADIYYRFPDPLACMAAAAAVTERLVIGTAVTLVTERDPIVLAKEIATIDHISGGRVEVGMGAGWNAEELRNHGTDIRYRFTVMRERIEAMKAIWTQEPASYHGRFVDFDPIFCGPKPVQKPHPLVYVAGDGAKVHDRVLAFGDGWMFNQRSHADDQALMERVSALQVRAQAERGMDSLPVTMTSAPIDGELLRGYAAAGVTRAVVSLRATPHDPIDFTRLDRIIELMEGIPA